MAGGDRADTKPSDELLAALVSQRDVDAFAVLYDRYARPVYTMAAHVLGAAEAEEVVQDVFLRLWNKAGQFDAGRGTFSAWFMAIARHHVLNELRRRSQQQRVAQAEKIDRLLGDASNTRLDPEETAWLRERGDALHQALKGLPAEQRWVLVLAYFGGLSQSDIAQRLGCPLGTVKKRIRLGLQKLRACLQQQGLAVNEPAGLPPGGPERSK